MSRVKLLAPTIASGDPGDYAKLPDVSPYVDSGDFHFYAGDGREPSNFGGGNFAAIADWYRAAASPARPVSISEWGQTTASKPGQGGCDEATQARYVLNQVCDVQAKGLYRAYLYQLMDDTGDGDPTGNGGAESPSGSSTSSGGSSRPRRHWRTSRLCSTTRQIALRPSSRPTACRA